MTAPRISQQSTEWAVLAGFQVTQGSEKASTADAETDGRPVIWTNHGEIRFYIGPHPSGWFVVTISERMADEELVFAAESIAIIELYLFGQFGWSIRSSMRLPLLQHPTSIDEMAAGYTVRMVSFDGRQRLALIDPTGSAIAMTAAGKIVGMAELICLSWYLDSSVDTLKTSYLDPFGQPLFTVRES